MKNICGIFFLLLFKSSLIYSQAGNLDNTFDNDGKTLTTIGTGNSLGLALAVQQDGKIVVAGYSTNTSEYFTLDFAVVRYNSDGTLDNTFDGDGKATVNVSSNASDYGTSVTIDDDGKILVAGYSLRGTDFDIALARLNTDGSPDNSFGTGGMVTDSIGDFDDQAYSVAVQSDGKILMAGSTSNSLTTDIAVLRYNSNGTLDTTFDIDGIVTTDFSGTSDIAYSIAVQPDGKILATGASKVGSTNNFAVVRYHTNGTTDNSFSNDGLATVSLLGVEDIAYSIALQSDGKIVLGGNSPQGQSAQFGLVRFNTDGTLDNSFGGDGKVNISFGNDPGVGYSVGIQPDSKIIIAGLSGENPDQKFAVARVLWDGSTDNTFSSDGKTTTDIGNGEDNGRAIALQADNKILVAGYSSQAGIYNFSLARYLSGLNVGMIDFATEPNSLFTFPNPFKDDFQLEYLLAKDEVLTLELYDITGRKLQSFFTGENRIAGEHHEMLGMGHYVESGNYYLVLSNGTQKVTINIVKE